MTSALAPEAIALLARLAAEPPDPDPDPVARRRAAVRRRRHWLGGERASGVGSEDLRLTARDGASIAARLYRPAGAAGWNRPLIVFAHGGGWVTGDLDTHDGLCAALVRQGQCSLLAVDYRRAPEWRWPVADQDVDDAVAWALAGGIDGRVDRLVVAGDSAGATIAATIAAARRGVIAGQLLIYPIVDAPRDRASYRAFAAGCGLDRAEMEWFWEQYRPDEAALPLRVEPTGLPRTLILAAGCDVLRDEGVEYAERLGRAGVDCERVEYPGLIHGFVRMSAVLPAADAAIDRAAEFLRDV